MNRPKVAQAAAENTKRAPVCNRQLLQLEPVLPDPLAVSAEKDKPPKKVERVKVRKAKNLHLPHLGNL